MRYIIWCTVSGGVTGSREAPLKHDGEVVYFNDEHIAQEHADKLNKRCMNCHHHAYVQETTNEAP